MVAEFIINLLYFFKKIFKQPRYKQTNGHYQLSLITFAGKLTWCTFGLNVTNRHLCCEKFCNSGSREEEEEDPIDGHFNLQ